MSPEMRTRRDGSARPRRKGAVQPFSVVWLALVWVILWQDLSIANLLAGAALAVGVQLAFPLPPLRLEGRVNPLALVRLLFSTLWQMLLASIDVSRQVLRFGRQPRSAVIEVDLATESDFILTLVGITVTLIPGSFVVEARRSTHSLFLHVLDAGDPAGAERERARVLRLEQRIIRAFGSRSEATP